MERVQSLVDLPVVSYPVVGSSSVFLHALVQAFGKRCKQALFVGDESSMEKVDPNQLKAECDRAIYNMEAQFRMLGPESLNTPEELLGKQTASNLF